MERSPSNESSSLEADHAPRDGKPGHGPRPSRGVWLACSICQREVPEPRPRVPSEWPRLIKAIAMFRQPTDKGVGDTIASNLNRIPAFKGMGAGDAFKTVMKALKIDCGCENRQKALNERYQYA